MIQKFLSMFCLLMIIWKFSNGLTGIPLSQPITENSCAGPIENTMEGCAIDDPPDAAYEQRNLYIRQQWVAQKVQLAVDPPNNLSELVWVTMAVEDIIGQDASTRWDPWWKDANGPRISYNYASDLTDTYKADVAGGWAFLGLCGGSICFGLGGYTGFNFDNPDDSRFEFKLNAATHPHVAVSALDVIEWIIYTHQPLGHVN